MTTMQADEILTRLRSFALRAKTPTVDLEVFLRSLAPEGLDLRSVEAGIRELSFRGAFSISMDRTRPASVTFPDFPLLALQEEYRRLARDASLPFPRGETLPVPIPQEELETLEAKGCLGPLLEQPGSPAMRGAVKFTFPDEVPALVVPRSGIGPELVDAAVARISRLLQEPRDAAFLESKLLGALKGSEAAVRQMMEDITLRPRKAAVYVISPTEFSFRFWSHLTHALVTDILAKGSRSDFDQTLLQAAHILSFAAFHLKGAAEREKERSVDRKSLELLVRKPPYVFTSSALYSFKDGKGAILSVKHGRQFIASFLEECTAATDEENLPYLVRITTGGEKKEYFVQRDFVVPVFLKAIGDAGDQLRVTLVKEWMEAMRTDRPPAVCRNDAVFRKEVEKRVRSEFPLVPAMAQVPLLQIASLNASLTDEAREELQRCFATETRLRPLHALLGLSRHQLYREARSYLPFWQTAPLISSIARFFVRLARAAQKAGGEPPGFDPRAAAAAVPFPSPGTTAAAVVAPGAAPAASHTSSDSLELERLRRALRALVSRYVPEGSSVARTLEELAERWNPLIEPGQKQDLVKDVNALARDFLRPIRRSFLAHPPDERRIEALADQLAASRSLAKIVNREPLLKYLSLYMVQTLLAP